MNIMIGRIIILLANSLLVFLLLSCETKSTTPFQSNKPPNIYSIDITPDDSVEVGDTLVVVCNADDVEGDTLTYNWSTSDEFLISIADEEFPFRMSYVAQKSGIKTVWVEVYDDWHFVKDSVQITIFDIGALNPPPQITLIEAEPSEIFVLDTTSIRCFAMDPQDDPLTYVWATQKGEIIGEDAEVKWIAPFEAGQFSVAVGVSDGRRTVWDEVLITVSPREVHHSDFNTDQVTGKWFYVGLMTGLGEEQPTTDIAWSEDVSAMAVRSRSGYSASGFRMTGESFNDGTYSVSFNASSNQYGLISFVPKFKDVNNYILAGLNLFLGQLQVLQCQNGQLQWLMSDWRSFNANQWYKITYTKAEGIYSFYLDNEQIWSGDAAQEIEGFLPLGVAVYGLQDSDYVYYDELRVTLP